jgi:tetratricopeptide (TPR) repeat protein
VKKINLKIVILFFISIACTQLVFAQKDLVDAHNYVALNQLDKAADIYKKLFDQNPADADVYNEYFSLLLKMKDYKTAQKTVETRGRIFQNSPLVNIDLGRIYMAMDKKKKADEEFDAAIKNMNGDDLITQQMANAFTAMNRDDYAIKTYEHVNEILHNAYTYSGPLAHLYAKTGAMDKAVNSMLDGGLAMNGGVDDVKATLLELLGSDEKKIQLAQKALIKKINEQPDNPFYAELLTWLYTQKNDWEGALIQIEALDNRNKEQGERMLDFARFATKEHQYAFALKTYDEIIAKGKELPYYGIAKSEKLSVKFEQLQNKPDFTKDDVTALENDYAAFVAEFPQQNTSQVVKDYATFEAQYANNPQKAIELLDKAIQDQNARRDFVGSCKLQMGDYYILLGRIWDASLIYSQVDKTFREDMLGEDARFRNAKLYYYIGDFNFAEGQLSVLKASTSELIANDALYLSVLITENTAADSNYIPLRRFAYADLLLFQNKDKEAEALLDSISNAFPEHPLKDDILMQKAKIAQKHREYNKALDYLKDIYVKFGKDVLGDDAVFKTAEIYEKNLHDNEKAKHFYEQLIIDYPGSTYIQTARNRLSALQSGTSALP